MNIIDDRELEIPVYSTVCTYCQNLRDGRTCLAFPDGIPMDIWMGENKHTKPFPGDNGIRFESVKK